MFLNKKIMSTSIRTNPWAYECNECDSIESNYPCPVYNCKKHGNENVNWTHTNCGGQFRLYENGKEKCQKCGVEYIFCLLNSSCSEKLDYCRIKNIIAKMSGMDTKNNSTFFFIHLSICIDKQYKDYPDKFSN